MTLSVLTLVRNRQAHLDQLIAGLDRSVATLAELVIIDMSDRPISTPKAAFPIRIERLPGERLPLAAARNRSAALAQGDQLLFLDVDCIPAGETCGVVAGLLEADDVVACPKVLYLPSGAARAAWTETDLDQAGVAHPVRRFPAQGARIETNPGLLWSLAFGMRRSTFFAVGGFDEAFVGYGAEDTDLGFRVAKAGVPMIFTGDGAVYHQHHDAYDPPLQHFAALIANARTFHQRWGIWPMDGWLADMLAMGLIDWTSDDLRVLRPPTDEELAAAKRPPSAVF